MNIVVINGGYRNGNTYNLTKMVEEKIISFGNVQFDYINLKEYKIDYCKSCHQCFLKGDKVCPHSETISFIQNKLINADGVIFISPVYSLQITALLKNFIDHTSVNFHRPKFYLKYAMVITTTAGGGHKSSAKYLKKVLTYWGFRRVLVLPYAIMDSKLKKTIKLEKIVKKNSIEFYKLIQRSELKQPTLKQIIFFQMWKNMMKYSPKDEADYKYWNENKFFDGRKYFVDKLSIIKSLTSLFFSILLDMIFKKVLKVKK